MRKRILVTILVLASFSFAGDARNKVLDTLGVFSSAAWTPEELMKGGISGVRVSSLDGNPNGAVNVNIRGLNTLRGDSQPVWIVDGVVLGNSVNENLNPFFLSGGKNSVGTSLPDYSGQSYTAPLGGLGWLTPNDIESVKVIKDMSATAIYGLSGANGVIVIKTRRPSSTGRTVRMSANMGVESSSVEGTPFRTGILQSYNVGISGRSGKSLVYNVSGFFRRDKAAVEDTGSNTGGVAFNFETSANSILKFGLNSFLSYGKSTSTAGVNYLGAPSTMLLARFPSAFGTDSLEGWLKDHDNDANCFRNVNSAWLLFSILPGLDLNVTGGADFLNQNRFIWYGTGTSFGKKFSSVAAILNNSLFNYNAGAELVYSRNLFVKHRLSVALSSDLNGKLNMTNSMSGSNFSFPSNRAHSLSASGSHNVIRKFNRGYLETGAYGKLDYDYDGVAGFDAVARLDINPDFDKDAQFFPSADIWLDLAKILCKEIDFLSTFRISGGYGRAGMERVVPYEYLGTFISGVPSVEEGAEYYYDGVNRLISSEFNAGIDLGFHKDRIKISTRFYDKETKDIFKIYNSGVKVNKLWTDSVEKSVVQERESVLGNRGIEFDADLTVLKSRNVDWSIYAVASWNANSILSADAADVADMAVVNGQYISSCLEGEPVGAAWGNSTFPSFYGGFGTSARFGRITVDARLSGASGFQILNATLLPQTGSSVIDGSMLEDGDYLRLDFLSASYDVPVKAKWVKGLRVSLSARNLLTLTKYSGWNPDVNCFGVNVRSNGVDYGSYPSFRMVMLGFNFEF